MTPPEFADLVEIFTDPLFDIPVGLTSQQQHELTYRRLRHVHERLDVDGPLLERPELLGTLLELAAMVDPGLFHVMFLHHCMTIGTVLDMGGADHDPAGLAELVSGRSIGAILMTELGQGNSIANVGTEAVYDPRTHEFVLHTPTAGATKFPPNVGLAGMPRLAVVGARLKVADTDRGIFLFLVRLGDASGPAPGVRISPQLATPQLDVDYASVGFDRVRVAYRDWLADGASIRTDPATGDVVFRDPTGDAQTRGRRSATAARFGGGAVSLGLAAVARAGVTIALTHAHRRESTDRFGTRRTVISYRNQQRLLFSALASAVAATALARRATESCWRIPATGQPGAMPAVATMRTAALTKVAVDRLAERAVARCRTACGALGFLSVNRLVDYQGLTLAFNAAGGDNQMFLLEAAWGMVNGADYEPPKPPSTYSSGQRDEGPQSKGTQWDVDGGIALLAARERLLHQHLSRHLTEAGGRGVDPFTAWNQRVDLAQRLAEAHAARMTMEATQEWAGAADSPRQAVERQLCRILLLEELMADAGWFVAEGLLTADQVRDLPDQLADADARLLPHARAVAELLGVPTGIVRSAILSEDYVTTLAAQAELATIGVV